MSYKTILVQVDDSRQVEPRIEAAAALAVVEGAHLVGVAVTGVSRFLYETLSVAPDQPDIAPQVETLRERGHEALRKFENLARQAGVISIESRLLDDEPSGGISFQARCCDLVVVGQVDPNDPDIPVSTDFPEYVVMNCGSPALIIPYADISRTIADRVMILWNASAEAARAVHGAIPLLQRAKVVEVVMFNPEAKPMLLGVPPGGDIKGYLARHDVKAEVVQRETDEFIGDAILSYATSAGAKLLVMGCYGHSRFREILLGGATRTALTSTTIPMLMAH